MLYLTTYFSQENTIYISNAKRFDELCQCRVLAVCKNSSLKKVERFNGASSIFINSPDDKLNDSICLLNSENFGKLRPKNC